MSLSDREPSRIHVKKKLEKLSRKKKIKKIKKLVSYLAITVSFPYVAEAVAFLKKNVRIVYGKICNYFTVLLSSIALQIFSVSLTFRKPTISPFCGLHQSVATDVR